MLQRHFQADTLPWIQRMRQKEQGLQRRLLRVMRIIEALEGKGCRMPLVKDEAELAEKLAALTICKDLEQNCQEGCTICSLFLESVLMELAVVALLTSLDQPR